MSLAKTTPKILYGMYDAHTKPHDSPTMAQLTLAVVWVCSVIYYLCTVFIKSSRRELKDGNTEPIEEKQKEDPPNKVNNNHTDQVTDSDVVIEVNGVRTSSRQEEVIQKTVKADEEVEKAAEKSKNFSRIPSPPDFDKFIQHVAVFGFIMFYFYLCDYVKILPMEERSYVRDTFLFLVFLLFLVGGYFTMRPTSDKILNRDQTEEWKGWMQVMFVWYHYFAAKEWYNWIRVYIAAYVWMTGFGNFSFFWIKKDFSPWRMMKMLFRLNFLVIFVCITVSNEYMLYYICAMHTYWFLSVYAFMGILSSWNTDRRRMFVKFTVYALCNAIIFEIPGVHMEIFRPFRFIFGFVDGKHDVMHEWAFRSGLDHWVCFIGMLCAYNYPHFEALMMYLESNSYSKKEKIYKVSVKVIMVLVLVGVFIAWHQLILGKEKYPYNAVHPYTSWIPILVFIIIRNIHPALRQRYIHMFAWLGKITLETYLSQLHIYLQSNAKHLLGYIPGYPLLSFSLATIVYLFLSHHLFALTTEFSAWLFPKNYMDIAKKFILLFVTFVIAGLIAYCLKYSGLIL